MNKIDNEKIKVYADITRLTIVICWVTLLCFWVIKLFGGNFFEIAVNNENFIKFSELVETTWLKYLVSFFTIAVAKYLTFGAICQKFVFKGKQLIFVIFGIVSIWAVSNFVPLGKLQFPAWYGYMIFVLAGFIYQKGCKKLFGLLSIALETIFTVVSFLTRNVPIVVSSNYLIAYTLSIDVYIMLALYCLYSNLIRINKEKIQ